MADEVMRKRWKWKNERLHFLPYEADDDKSSKQLDLEHAVKYLGLCVRRPYKIKKSKLEQKEVVWPKSMENQWEIEDKDGNAIPPIEPVNDTYELEKFEHKHSQTDCRDIWGAALKE